MATTIDPNEAVGKWFAVVKSLNEFDKIEIRNAVKKVSTPTRRDVCFGGSYYRTCTNIESILSLKRVGDFQAIAMIARSLFEIAVDIKLAAVTEASEEKILTFVDLEKLRAAEKIVAFKEANPEADVPAHIYQTFIKDNKDRITRDAKTHWQNNYVNVTHWSALNLEKRIKKLGTPFLTIYALYYPQLSWYVHSGMTGVFNLQEEAFRLVACEAFVITTEAYMVVLAEVIKHFQIDKANDKIMAMMRLAKMLPFTDGAAQAEELKCALLG